MQAPSYSSTCPAARWNASPSTGATPGPSNSSVQSVFDAIYAQSGAAPSHAGDGGEEALMWLRTMAPRQLNHQHQAAQKRPMNTYWPMVTPYLVLLWSHQCESITFRVGMQKCVLRKLFLPSDIGEPSLILPSSHLPRGGNGDRPAAEIA